ncbi:shikimate dehydrogenase [Chloroflexota bacterium]
MEANLISGKTKICGVIGDPIEHTMSPVMHNAAFRKLGMDYVYLPFRVKKEELGKAVAGMRALNIRGLNVTLPHKVAIIPFLDKLDSLAERIGAVNTVVNDGGELTGYNTDAAGFLQVLLENGVKPEGKKIIVLGAGGASQGICFILAGMGAHLIIVNRRLARAEDLLRQISPISKSEVEALALNEENLTTALEKADILVNTTSIGMIPDISETPVPAKLFKPGLIVFDIVYNPIRTRLLKEAEAAGARTLGGLDMLVWQGALAFEKWTGQKAPLDLMKAEAVKVLENEN